MIYCYRKINVGSSKGHLPYGGKRGSFPSSAEEERCEVLIVKTEICTWYSNKITSLMHVLDFTPLPFSCAGVLDLSKD